MCRPVGNEASATDAVVTSVDGHVDDMFSSVRDVFGRCIATQGKGGAALCVYLNGRPVVDLIGGAYRPNSVQLLFSVTKAITAIACAKAHDAGALDLDAPLGSYWRAFNRAAT